ncbi:hypothetical protein [Streptomyces arboris]|uniref:Uncharacterized protein n=1 Tax=Streptomyces arboris TaxID=2600619 RepID=A0A5N5EIH6_9ACTN|nr:hypothetical protein [Streptomyces arboris]KAB2588382.1 hypothetical protein F5983_32580 [Streptomyces arboris]
MDRLPRPARQRRPAQCGDALDGGLWLHHTLTADADHHDALTLLVPCDCDGYVLSLLEGQSDLLELLQELRPTGGRAVHSGDTGGPYCVSTPAT